MSLTNEELEALAADVENYRVERKSSFTPAKTKIEEAICAFANDLPNSGQPGYLLIGVDDDGTPTGLEITDALLQSIAAIRSDGNILPFPQLSVERRKLRGVVVAVVVVLPSKNTPLRLRGRVCVRVGPRRDTATRDEERALTERRRAWDGPFDQTPVHGATIDDLDLDLFTKELLPNAVDEQTLAQNQRSTPEQLASLHLASPDAVPNVAGLLLLGQEPTAFIKGAYVQFLRLEGAELTDPIADRRELTGPPPEVLRRMDDLARSEDSPHEPLVPLGPLRGRVGAS
jgi:ATP-dependent DNA helicase RecG